MTDRKVRSLLPVNRTFAAQKSVQYDAFLSYSRDSDGEFAPAFHAQLLEFDKRDDVPDLNIFLDRTGLANNSSLWDAIERKLERSRYFILFASEGAASSKYVTKEVEWWLEHRELDTILVALTSGRIVWDQTANAIDTISSTALPAPLAEVLDHEPKWTDLTGLRQRRFWRHHPDRPTAFAELVAPLRGPDVSTEEILSTHIARQSSGRVRGNLVNVALGVMLALSIGAFAFADREADRANEAVNADAAHLLGARSYAAYQDDPVTAQLLAAEAVQRLDDAQNRSALFNAVTASDPADPYLLRTVDLPGETVLADDVATTTGGIVGRTDAGDLVRWNLDDRGDGDSTGDSDGTGGGDEENEIEVLHGDRTPFSRVAEQARSSTGHTSIIDGSSDGSVVAAVDDLGVTIGWFGSAPDGTSERQTHFDLAGTTAVALTSEGDRLVVAWHDADSGRDKIGSLDLRDLDLDDLKPEDGAPAGADHLAFYALADTELAVTSLAVGSSRTLTVADSAAGVLELRNLDNLTLSDPVSVDLPKDSVPSPSLRDWATLATDGDSTTVTVHHWADGSSRAADCPVPRAWSDPELVAIDDETTRALVTTDEGLVACEVHAGIGEHRTWHLSGVHEPGPPVLLGVERVIAASGGRIALWSTAETHGDAPLPGSAGTAAATGAAGPTPVLATFRDDEAETTSTAMSWSDGSVMIHGLGTVTLPDDSDDVGRPLLPVWLDRNRLLLITAEGDAYRTQGGTVAEHEAGFRDLVVPILDGRDPDCARFVSAQRTQDDILLADACSNLYLLDEGLETKAMYVPSPPGEAPRLGTEWAEPGRIDVTDDGSRVAVAPRDFALRVADLDAAAADRPASVWTVRGSSVAQVHLMGPDPAEVTSRPGRLITLGEDSVVRERSIDGPDNPRDLGISGTYGDVMAVLPGPDLVARNQGTALSFFDIRTGLRIGELATSLYAPEGQVAAGSVSADDGQLLVVQDHGVTAEWAFSDDQMIARACAMAGRDATSQELPEGVEPRQEPTCESALLPGGRVSTDQNAG